MPKFYIDDGAEQTVITAKNAHSACIKALMMGKFASFMVNGTYRVSERGHEEHDDDLMIPSEAINNFISKRTGMDINSIIKEYGKNDNKDEDTP